MNAYYADLHIHLGRDGEGHPVKIAASSDLTVSGVIEECSTRKGIHIAGIVDCHSPGVIRDLERLVAGGRACELSGGGIWVPGPGAESTAGVTVIPASEVELTANGGRFHLIAYLPSTGAARGFSSWLEPRVTNLSLSSQKCRADPDEVVESVRRLGGFCVPAHVFTPHRGVLGCCADRLASVFAPSSLDSIPAVELGLSADTDMADTIDEMALYTFLSNSDAHSKGTIGRECNLLLMDSPGFCELECSLRRTGSRRVGANYGLDPRLGKYHRTFCMECGRPALGGEAALCPTCGSPRVVRGVWDRVRRIASYDHPVHPAHRPPYVHQVPLSFIPGVG
ncbi:MAG: TIGR00375 family protein, partial [Bacillota bacterium]